MSDLKDKAKEKIDDAADAAKKATEKVADKAKDIAHKGGQKNGRRRKATSGRMSRSVRSNSKMKHSKVVLTILFCAAVPHRPRTDARHDHQAG